MKNIFGLGLLFSLFLSGCGGGGDSSGAPQNDQIIDDPSSDQTVFFYQSANNDIVITSKNDVTQRSIISGPIQFGNPIAFGEFDILTYTLSEFEPQSFFYFIPNEGFFLLDAHGGLNQSPAQISAANPSILCDFKMFVATANPTKTVFFYDDGGPDGQCSTPDDIGHFFINLQMDSSTSPKSALHPLAPIIIDYDLVGVLAVDDQNRLNRYDTDFNFVANVDASSQFSYVNHGHSIINGTALLEKPEVGLVLFDPSANTLTDQIFDPQIVVHNSVFVSRSNAFITAENTIYRLPLSLATPPEILLTENEENIANILDYSPSQHLIYTTFDPTGQTYSLKSKSLDTSPANTIYSVERPNGVYFKYASDSKVFFTTYENDIFYAYHSTPNGSNLTSTTHADWIGVGYDREIVSEFPSTQSVLAIHDLNASMDSVLDARLVSFSSDGVMQRTLGTLTAPFSRLSGMTISFLTFTFPRYYYGPAGLIVGDFANGNDVLYFNANEENSLVNLTNTPDEYKTIF